MRRQRSAPAEDWLARPESRGRVLRAGRRRTVGVPKRGVGRAIAPLLEILPIKRSACGQRAAGNNVRSPALIHHRPRLRGDGCQRVIGRDLRVPGPTLSFGPRRSAVRRLRLVLHFSEGRTARAARNRRQAAGRPDAGSRRQSPRWTRWSPDPFSPGRCHGRRSRGG